MKLTYEEWCDDYDYTEALYCSTCETKTDHAMRAVPKLFINHRKFWKTECHIMCTDCNAKSVEVINQDVEKGFANTADDIR